MERESKHLEDSADSTQLLAVRETDCQWAQAVWVCVRDKVLLESWGNEKQHCVCVT